MTPEEITQKKALIKAQVKHIADLINAVDKSVKELSKADRDSIEAELEAILAKCLV